MTVSQSGSVLDAAALAELRAAVRSFLRDEVMSGGFTPQVDGWGRCFSREFSLRLAERGWVGMTIPVEYGGGGRSHLERFIVAEELVVAGAPVLAHWSAERQIAPMLLRIGTEAQKAKLLPGIARGQLSFGLGLSEPGAGSDLAAVATRAEPVHGGWRLTGQKVWTSAAHRAEYMSVLCRTDSDADRHRGLSQLLVDMTSNGIEVRPIVTMGGDAEFCEVFFDGVFVPDDAVLGTVGNGWAQATQELGWERTGPDRYLSTYPLLERFFAVAGEAADADAGRLAARIAALRALSFRIAIKGQAGVDFSVDAALAKDAGSRFEQDSVDIVRRVVGSNCEDDQLRALLRSAQLVAPTFTLRGGTNEILRSIVAKQLTQGAAS